MGLCAAAIAVLLTGCGDGAEPTEPTTPVIAMGDEVDSFPAAIVTGQLELRDGCLTIDDAVALFSAGTEWDDGAQAVVMPDGTTWAVGDSVEGGGGFVSAHGIRDTRLGDAGTEAAFACAQRLDVADVAVISGAT